MSLPDRPSVSVVLPAHRGDELLARALASWARVRPAPLELLVVADGAAPGVAERVAAAAPAGAEGADGIAGLRLVHAGGDDVAAAPAGPAAARNAGAREARGDVLFFVDRDVEVPADVVARVAGRFAREPELAALIGSYDDDPAAPGLVSQYKNLLHHWVHQEAPPEAFTFWGACGAVRRELFLALGGFDPAYRRPSIEDIELGYRLGESGHPIRLDRDLQVKHLKHWSFAELLVSDVRDRALPWSALILERGRLDDGLNIDRRSRASAFLAAGVVAGLGAAAAGRLRGGLALAGGAGAALLVLHRRFYGFLRRRRGGLFVAAAVPLHWLYFLYSAGAFGVAALRQLARRRPGRGGR